MYCVQQKPLPICNPAIGDGFFVCPGMYNELPVAGYLHGEVVQIDADIAQDSLKMQVCNKV
jgi:hypothetical protein